VPASFCGLYGLRPTHGRIDLSGGMAMAPSFDTAGWFASGPGVFRRVGEVLLDGERVEAKVAQVTVADDAFEQADAEVTALLTATLEAAAPALPKPRRMRIAPEGFDGWREAFRIVQAFETWGSFGDFIARAQPKLGPGIKERMEFAASVTAAQADAARPTLAAARAHIRALAPLGTVIALPSAPTIAPLIDTPADAMDAFRVRVMRLTCIAGISGLPQVSIPAGTVAGCPVGLSFVGWAGGDEALLDLAATMSRYCGVSG
jgi:amidase